MNVIDHICREIVILQCRRLGPSERAKRSVLLISAFPICYTFPRADAEQIGGGWITQCLRIRGEDVEDEKDMELNNTIEFEFSSSVFPTTCEASIIIPI